MNILLDFPITWCIRVCMGCHELAIWYYLLLCRVALPR